MAKPVLALPDADCSGFLCPREGRELFNADIYIAAIARSGSTLLCDLMTFPTGNICLIEPRFYAGMRAERSQFQLKAAGFDIPDERWKALESKTKASYMERYTELIAPVLRQCTRWGVKEVRAELHRPTIETINPAKILVLVRNARDVAVSLCQKILQSGGSPADAAQFVEGYLSRNCACLVEFADSANTIVARYEDFARSETELRNLAVALDWPFEGIPNQSFERLGRSVEAERHTGTVTSARRHDLRSLPPELFSVIEKSLPDCELYQRRFGYS